MVLFDITCCWIVFVDRKKSGSEVDWLLLDLNVIHEVIRKGISPDEEEQNCCTIATSFILTQRFIEGGVHERKEHRNQNQGLVNERQYWLYIEVVLDVEPYLDRNVAQKANGSEEYQAVDPVNKKEAAKDHGEDA